MTIRTRFAPSPTGYLHIGGVRTALFNWLLARRHGGQFILRIDDTDAERNRPEALQPILDGFRWLGINWDEGPEVGGPHAPYFQSGRNDKHVAAAVRLLESGHAYPDYQTKDELDADRKAAEAAKRPYVHRGRDRDLPAAEALARYRERPAPLRFKVPSGRTSVVNDIVRGKVEVRTDLIGDPIILRVPDAAGVPRPLYNFASVVDDIDMNISHVVRASEHLSNTSTQVLFFEALGAPLPRFAHIPVVNEPAPSKKKLSKRDMKKFVTADVRAKLHAVGWTDEQIDLRDDLNPATVAFYRELGYLPAGLVNYLGRLGWALDDHSENIPIDQMTAAFALEDVSSAPAGFDLSKLYWLAGEHMKALSDEDKVAGCLPYLQRAELVGDPATPADLDKLRAVVRGSGDRIKLFSDIIPYGKPFFVTELEYDPKAVEKRLKKAGGAEVLRGFGEALRSAESFDAPALEQLLNDYCTGRGIKLSEAVHPIRVATTGVEVGFGLFDVLAVLGKDEVLRRFARGLELAKE